jgi:hypothetical protein
MGNRKNAFGLALLIFLLACLLAGCSGSVATEIPTVTPTETPADTPTPTEAPATVTPEATPTDENVVTISVNNDTGDMVCGVFAYNFETTGEHENLVPGMVMMPGGTFDFQLEKGVWYIDVYDCAANKLHSLAEFEIAEGFDWDLSEVPESYVYEGQQSLVLTNERAWDICELYIRPYDSEDWGENLFYPESDYYLAAGSTLIEPLESGTFDFKLVYCDGTVASVMEDLEVPEGQSMEWTLTP